MHSAVVARTEEVTMFYVISSQRIDCLQGSRRENDHAIITTAPGYKNFSGEPCSIGWLGVQNDVSVTAHGEFETRAEARAALPDLGYVDVADERGQYKKD